MSKAERLKQISVATGLSVVVAGAAVLPQSLTALLSQIIGVVNGGGLVVMGLKKIKSSD